MDEITARIINQGRYVGHLTQERNTMPNTPHTMLDQVGRNTTQHGNVSWGKIAVYVATGLFIVYGMPWIITWAAQWVQV